MACLAVLCLTLPALSASAQVLYDNGPINGNAQPWDIVNGFIVSDTFTVSSGQTVTGFELGVWNEGSDPMTSLQWSLTSGENSGTVYGSGVAESSGGSGGTLMSQFLSQNQFGYTIDEITVTKLNINFASGGTYWLNLQNAKGNLGDYYFWDENSGIGCGGNGCPSSASDSGVGTIPSESFTITGMSSTGTTPEPSSFMLLASGAIALAGVLRRKLL
jgi:PEP-CTERM motif